LTPPNHTKRAFFIQVPEKTSNRNAPFFLSSPISLQKTNRTRWQRSVNGFSVHIFCTVHTKWQFCMFPLFFFPQDDSELLPLSTVERANLWNRNKP
jgi:hypothetical protein